MTPQKLNTLLLDLLDEMEQAAGPGDDAYPVGLRWITRYVQFRDELEKEPRNHEVQWTRELTDKLRGRRFRAVAEQKYPSSRDRCDVVLSLDEIGDHWIEAKGCWPALLDDRKPNKSFRKHLLATAHDVDKLVALPKSIASGVSLIIIAFDDDEFAVVPTDLDVITSKLQGRDWIRDYKEWWSTGTLRYRTRIWIWTSDF